MPVAAGTVLIALGAVAVLVALTGGGVAVWWTQCGASALDLPITGRE